MDITQKFDDDGITLNRESVFYDGMWWHRYPNAKSNGGRKYFCKKINKIIIYLHHYIWKKYNGIRPKGMHIDHIDGNPANNNINNLQCLTPAEHNTKHKTGNKNNLGHKHSDESKEKMKLAQSQRRNAEKLNQV